MNLKLKTLELSKLYIYIYKTVQKLVNLVF